MTEQLSTPLTHRLIASPVGLLFQSRLFERVKIATVDREFGVLRARAAADVADADVDAFLDELDVASPVDQSLRTKITRALTEHQSAKARYRSLATEWDDRVDEYRTRAYRYRTLLEWAGAWTTADGQATLHDGILASCEDAARAYSSLELTPALHIEPRDSQQAALDARYDPLHGPSRPTGIGEGSTSSLSLSDSGSVVSMGIHLRDSHHSSP